MREVLNSGIRISFNLYKGILPKTRKRIYNITWFNVKSGLIYFINTVLRQVYW